MRTPLKPSPDIWSLVKGAPWVDPEDLLAAIEHQCRLPSLDYRTRLLVHESLIALGELWGPVQLRERISVEIRPHAIELLEKQFGEVGFPTLGSRLKNQTDIQTFGMFFRELGEATREPVRLEVGGSTALILRELLRRGTEDIDVVNEVPMALRLQHDLLSKLASRYGLLLTHFQSHYLPDGYESRMQFFRRFEQLEVYLVDALDIFVGKLFSRREKDLDDLRLLISHYEKSVIIARLSISSTTLRSELELLANAQRNWFILFGESLPTTARA